MSWFAKKMYRWSSASAVEQVCCGEVQGGQLRGMPGTARPQQETAGQ